MAVAAASTKGQRTQLRLLDAAGAELLARNGHLEIGTVARAAGVAPSVVYHHFGSKAGLVGAVVQRYYARLGEEVLDVDLRPLGDWPTRERERIRRGVRFQYAEPLAPIVYGSLSRDPAVTAIEARGIQAVVKESARNIGAAQRTGDLPRGVDPALAAAGIFGAMRQLLVEALSRRRRPSQRAVVEQLWRITAAAVSIPERSLQ